jgi:hypothetical protein
MVKLPPQSKEEIEKIKQQFEADFLFLKKEDAKQRQRIREYIDGDEYEYDDEYLDEGWV